MLWFKAMPKRRGLLHLLCAALCVGQGLAAQTLDSLARAHRDKPSPQTLSALLLFAERHPADQDGALALLAAGSWESGNGRYAEAIRHLEAARKRLPKLADYASFWLASARLGAMQFDEVLRDIKPIAHHAPSSPLAPGALLFSARAHLGKGDFEEALRVLKAQGAELQQPQGDMLIAKIHEAAGNLPAAAAAYQRVFFRDALKPESGLAEQELARLQAQLGDNYPPPLPQAMLTRAARLLHAGDAARARREFEALIPKLGGAEKDVARVRAGVARYEARETKLAFNYFRDLQVSSPEADAERLHYVLASARRLERVDEFNEPLELLARKYPDSRWRLESLLSAGNHFLLENSQEQYEPLYRACYESFAPEVRGAYCHWKLVWAAYLRRAPEAAEMLRTHLLTFPQSEKAGAALYHLGRAAQDQNDLASAKAYYAELQKRFPNSYYYLVPGGASLAQPAIAKAAASPEVLKFLGSLKFPPRPNASFEASGTTRERIERARLLVGAALDPWAQGELRHAARTDGQGHALAYEMARIEAQRGSAFQALRYIKGFAPGYLFLPFESAPLEFWRLAFPMPYRDILEKYCRAHGLDPFLIAALILQESEFNPGAISRAKARGLTQVMAGTGAQIARRLGIRRFAAGMLYNPEINIRLGTYYFRQMLDQHGGNVEKTLAAYNAGKSRVDRWSLWGDYREPGEFIETIPFTETRGYVQIVLRNAAMYRRLYGPGAPAVSSDGGTARN